jgi:general stress protein 26
MRRSPIEMDGTTWFFTDCGSRKVLEVEQDESVCLTYYGRRCVTVVTGTAERSDDRAEMAARWTPGMRVWYPHGIDEPGLCLLRVKLDDAEYWHTRFATPGEIVGTLQALLRRERRHVTEREHGRFSLR